jgi:hypothetical protein
MVSDEDAPSQPPQRRLMTIAVAFAIFVLAIAIFAVPALRLGSGTAVAGATASASDYPPPPLSGYWVLFPNQISQGDGSGAQVIAETNLPEGTVYQTGSTVFGPIAGKEGGSSYGCCESVTNGVIGLSAGNDTCNALAGGVGNSAGFTVSVTVTPTVDTSRFSGPAGSSVEPIRQPASVIAVLGEGFERLTGDQVQELPDGAGKELAATATYDWPEPQCGGNSLPLFGGPDCQPARGQLQGDGLNEVMGEVMGAISQGRMCEFWGTELPPDVEREHPWGEFSNQWRDWYVGKDFTDAQSNADWSDPPLTWNLVGRDGAAFLVDVTDHGASIVRLRVEPLPDYCPDCGQNVVSFWGVTAWTFEG